MAEISDPKGHSSDRLRTVAFHAAWMAILLAAAWKRFSPPLLPVAEGDSGAILSPAISLLTGRGFHPGGAQSFLYPGLLSALLGVFKDFHAITIVSHLLGLAAGLLLLASWRSAAGLLGERRIRPVVHEAAGLAMFAISVFALAPMQLEYTIRPDSICPFFAALSIYCVARFLGSRTRAIGSDMPKASRGSSAANTPGQDVQMSHPEGCGSPCSDDASSPRLRNGAPGCHPFGTSAHAGKHAWIAWGAAVLFLGFLLPTLKPSFWLSGIFSTIPVWFALFNRREKLAHRALMAGPSLAAFFFLLFLPGRHFSRMDRMNSSFFPESIFSIHALMIREQIAADLTKGIDFPYSRPELESTLALLDAGIQASREANPRKFTSLGYDADGLLHTDVFFPKMEALHGPDWPLQFYRYYFWRTWKQQPRAMAAKVVKQLRLFYNFDCPAYRRREIDLKELYRYSIRNLSEPYVQAFMGRWPPAADFVRAQALAAATAPDVRTPPLFDWALAALAATYFPSMLLFLAALPWALWDRARRARYGRFIALLAVAYGYSAGNNLGIAIFHTLEVTRYAHVQFGTTLFSQWLCLLFLGEIAAQMVARTGTGE